MPVRSPLGDEWLLGADEAAVRAAEVAASVRLLPSGDAYFLLDGKERELLVPRTDQRERLWTSRVWPGALLVEGEIRGTWRRSQHTVRVDAWSRLSRRLRDAVEAEAASLPLPGIDRRIEVVWERMSPRVGILWRAEWDPVDPSGPVAERCRLHGMFSAFAALGVEAEPVVYSDDAVDAVRDAAAPAGRGARVGEPDPATASTASRLDALLREVADRGVWVSAHPDVIQKMATKQVLVDTARMSWSAETHLYGSLDQLRAELPGRLARGPLVLKQQRGMGGEGVWKVELDAAELVRVQHAASGSPAEVIGLADFIGSCAPYFAGGGLMVEQPFQPRLDEGMIRVYLSHDEVVGFAHQYPRGLLDPDVAARLPTEKAFLAASADGYQVLRERMEQEWVGELQRIVGVDRESLPVIWDADFLLGEEAGTYVLCEINASSTFAFPEHAMPTVARAALGRIG